jgi:hypothetical protein
MPFATCRVGFAALAASMVLSGAGCGLGLGGELAVTDDGGGNSAGNLTGDDGDDSGATMSAHHDAGHGSSGGGTDPTDDSGALDDGGGGDDGPAPPPGDSGSGCNYNGTWGTKITIPVNWVPQGIMSVILAPGTGVIEQWIMSTRVVSGKATTDTASVCGIVLPDFSGTGFVGGETYGVRFPDSLFDNPYIPPFAIAGTLSNSTPNAAFNWSATAVLIGLKLPGAATAPWPATITTEVDMDMDMEPGVTAKAATGLISGRDGAAYQNIPVGIDGSRASQVYVAIRQVTALSGGASDCDHISGTVTIPKIQSGSTSKYAIDSHVIGCGLVGGAGDCSATQTAFVDGTQPVFSPTPGSTFTSVRMPTATCAAVRQALP